ncbi:MAG: hypothetical protein KDA84_03220, partial [Planctomycetaceae bacterium]|nr:hypothetical protein [Planctomycetaceae bacterium]
RLDAALGVTDGSPHERFRRGVWGVLVPLVPFGYGVSSLLTGHSVFLRLSRYQEFLRELSGRAALMAGLGYVCLGLLLHIHFLWHEHPQLAGVADAARLVSLLGLLASLFGLLFMIYA